MKKKNQAIVISGESGAGKTEAAKACLQFLSDTAGSSNGVEHKILQSNPILEAFGNAKTIRNDNSSRFGKWIVILFNDCGKIVTGQIVVYLLEKIRVVQIEKSERSFHIFYQLCAGLSNIKKKRLHLRPAKKYNYLKNTIKIPGVSDSKRFKKLIEAFKRLKIKLKKMEEIWTVLASILNLGNLVFMEKPGKNEEGLTIQNMEQLIAVADNLKLDPQTLETALCYRCITIRGSVSMVPLSMNAAHISRDSLAKDLYGKLFDWIVHAVNQKLATNQESSDMLRIGMLDIFGFEIFENNDFEQLCINYANEKLQQQFTYVIMKRQQKEYQSENIRWEKIAFKDNVEVLSLLENRPNGIFAFLDEEASVPRGSIKGFIQKLNKTFLSGKHRNKFYEKHKTMPSEGFVVKHYAGKVSYNATKFLQKNKDNVHESLSMLISKSGITLVRDMLKKRETPEEEKKK